MKPKTLILMGVAITCGLGASYMTSRLLAERHTSDEAEKVIVLVAKKNLNMGDTIKVPEDVFIQKAYTRGEEPANAIVDAEQLKGRVLKRPLRANDFVTSEDLLGDKDGDFLNVKLPPGYRAVGVRVNVESSAYGFASLPHSRVDVISTVRRSDDKTTYSQVLLENVLVLAADDRTQRDESGKPMPSQVVTLALKPEDALKISLAGELGTLRLMLRKMGDATSAQHSKLNYEALKSGEFSGDETPEVEAPKVAPVPPPAPKVEAPQVAEAKPATRLHRLWISEGDQTRQAQFQLNERGEVVFPDGGPGEVHPPRPAPDRQAPPAPHQGQPIDPDDIN
jgi:pilus assembly protein CpaB